jgi:hypothetical protein
MTNLATEQKQPTVNSLTKESRERFLHQELAEKMRAAYEAIAVDQDLNVEEFLNAQAEVLTNQ